MKNLDVRRFDDEDFEFESNDHSFKKIDRTDRPRMPVSSGNQAQKNSKKTVGSKKVKKHISQKSGGMHRRRQRTVR